MMLIQHPVNSDWLFNTQSRVLPGNSFIFKISVRSILDIR